MIRISANVKHINVIYRAVIHDHSVFTEYYDSLAAGYAD